MNRKLILFLALLVISLSACTFSSPRIEIGLESFEFGDVVNGDIVSKDIKVKNVGNSPLIIDSVSTSCGCTTAEVEPMAILPGEEATLHIEFDSGAHGPDVTGELMRQVFINSNASNEPEAMIQFTANIIER